MTMLTHDVKKAIQAELKATHSTEVSQNTVKAFMDSFEAVTKGALVRGEDVKLKGFVDFTSKAVEKREAKNPKTGADVTVEAHRKSSAKLAKGLRKF